MKTRDLTVLTIGLLTFSLTVKYDVTDKKVAVFVTAIVWEWAWEF